MPEELEQWIASLTSSSPAHTAAAARAADDEFDKNAEHVSNVSSNITTALSAQPRVIYVAFGTNVDVPPAVLSEMYQGLVDALDQGLCDGVIWAISSTKRGRFPGQVHPRVQLLGFAPQIALLRHPAVKLFVSHGGAESSHEAMFAGKPMLVVPFFGECATGLPVFIALFANL
jgi:UDP:flavonoid glycosyltransferase YjiC (YdhE family)